MCPPMFHKLLYKLLTTLCVVSDCAPPSPPPPPNQSLSYASILTMNFPQATPEVLVAVPSQVFPVTPATRNRWTRTLIIRKLVRIPIRILTFNLYWLLWGYINLVVFSLRGGSYHTSYHPRWKYTHSPT